jgi:hypothetical protein
VPPRLLEQGHAAEAVKAYEQSLDQYPGRFNSLLGAARAARRAGDDAAARAFYRQLLTAADAGSARPGLREATEFLPAR